MYLLRLPTVVASNNDSDSEISLYKVKKDVFFNEVSCFVCECMVSGLNYFLLLWGPFLLLCFSLLLSGESATAAPQPNGKYRFLLIWLLPV